jgi:transposase
VYRKQLSEGQESLQEVDQQIQILSQTEVYRDRVRQLCAFKGIQTLTAMIILAEIVDFRRFASAEAFMSFLGLVPSDYSSGQSERRGSITKDGNCHVRKALVESAWHYRHGILSKRLKERQSLAPLPAVRHANKALRRLNKRFHYLVNKGKSSQTAVVAVARELAGFIWAVMNHAEERTPVVSVA